VRVYLDTSVLVQQYLEELDSVRVKAFLLSVETPAVSLVVRAETSAAFAKASRLNWVTRDAAAAALGLFRADWPSLTRLAVTEAVMAEADRMAWAHGLRGYDAVHLASAALWQDAMGSPVTVATFDRQLWDAAAAIGMDVWPVALQTGRLAGPNRYSG
jgi:uncharacterized protein